MSGKDGLAVIVAVAIGVGGVLAWRFLQRSESPDAADLATPTHRDRERPTGPAVAGSSTSAPARPLATKAADETVVRALCSECHRFPEPTVQPRSSWALTISRMSRAPLFGKNMRQPYDLAAVARWYEERAPAEHSLESVPDEPDPAPLRFERRTYAPAEPYPEDPMVSCVRLVDVSGDELRELLVADMRHGVVLLGRPYEDGTRLVTLANVGHPAHVEVVDFDGDGRRDLLVANLGTLLPEDHTRGTVEWLRQTEDGRFEQVTLLKGVGRVSDVQPGDLDGDGDLDLTVAEFGQTTTGSVFVLENRSTDPRRPQFTRHSVDPRHGALYAPILDLDGDGRPDFVTLFAQEHEALVAFLNRGDFHFEPHVLSQAPHPEWGYTGLAATDLDGDGDVDFLLTNGDTLDTGRAHPDHGIEWAENRGGLVFERRRIATFYGVQAARPADLDGDGDLDLIACAFLKRSQRPEVEFASVAWFEQTAPGAFARHVLETNTTRHMAVDAGDDDGDGDVDFAVGEAGVFEPASGWTTVWRNAGSAAAR